MQPPRSVLLYSPSEAAIVTLLHSHHELPIEQLIERSPDLSWGQVFLAVDALSRRGVVNLRCRDFTYQVQLVEPTAV